MTGVRGASMKYCLRHATLKNLSSWFLFVNLLFYCICISYIGIDNCFRRATHLNISSLFSQISSFSDKERVDAVIKVFQYKDGISGRGPHYIIGTNGQLTSTLIHIQTPMRIWQKHIKNSLIKTFKVWSPSNSFKMNSIWLQ